MAGPVVLGAAGARGFAVPVTDALCGLAAGGGCLGIGIPIYNAAGKHVCAARPGPERANSHCRGHLP